MFIKMSTASLEQLVFNTHELATWEDFEDIEDDATRRWQLISLLQGMDIEHRIPVCYARSSGGHLAHVVNRLTGKALCGYKPKSSAYSSMKGTRGSWVRESTSPKIAYRECDKCKERYQERKA